MYIYDDYDDALVKERVAQFRDQVARRLSDELSEEEFLPLGWHLHLFGQEVVTGQPFGLSLRRVSSVYAALSVFGEE